MYLFQKRRMARIVPDPGESLAVHMGSAIAGLRDSRHPLVVTDPQYFFHIASEWEGASRRGTQPVVVAVVRCLPPLLAVSE